MEPPIASFFRDNRSIQRNVRRQEKRLRDADRKYQKDDVYQITGLYKTGYHFARSASYSAMVSSRISQEVSMVI